jgi:hypothetical protein
LFGWLIEELPSRSSCYLSIDDHDLVRFASILHVLGRQNARIEHLQGYALVCNLLLRLIRLRMGLIMSAAKSFVS